MMKAKIGIIPEGIAAVAKSGEVQALVAQVANEIAGNIRGMGITVQDMSPGSSEIELPVEVNTSVGKRARAEVVLAHPAGVAVQAKYGALTKAASAAGADVH